MLIRCRGVGKRAAQVAIATPLAVLAMSVVSTPAFAAGQGAANASTHANGGVGNGAGNGNTKHDTSTGSTTSTSTSTSTSTGTSTDSSAASHVTSGTAGTSGDPTQPQPLSNADTNKGGANGQCPGGPYCSTRNGSPSGNGNGKGKAVGKPCAGCVGKADNKNPHGQMPNGSDHNAGYECDRNHGIGRTNPAHTGCTTGDGGGGGGCTSNCGGGGGCTTDCGGTGCTTDCTTGGGGGGDCTTNPNAAGCDNGNQGCVPTSANNFCSSVLGEKKTRVLGERVSRSLPFTGADVAPMLGVAALAMIAGAGLSIAARRRDAA